MQKAHSRDLDLSIGKCRPQDHLQSVHESISRSRDPLYDWCGYHMAFFHQYLFGVDCLVLVFGDFFGAEGA